MLGGSAKSGFGRACYQLTSARTDLSCVLWRDLSLKVPSGPRFNAPSLSRRTGDMQRKAAFLLSSVAMATVATSAFAARPLETVQGQGVPIGPVNSPALATVLYDNMPAGAESVFSTTSA